MSKKYMTKRATCLKKIYSECLKIENELDVHLFFNWSPHVDGIDIYTYTPGYKWIDGGVNENTGVAYSNAHEGTDLDEWLADVLDKLNAFADQVRKERADA